jgi:acyl carrier protein
MQVDWPTLLGALPPGTRPPLFDELAATDPGSAGRPEPAPAVRARLAAADPDERRPLLEAFVREQIVRVLGLDPAAALDPMQGLSDVGMDSLMAVELSNRLRAGLELDLASTIAFEYPTFRDLSDFLAGELALSPEPAKRSSGAAPRSAPASNVMELSDDEVAERLLRELDDSGY